MYYWQEMYISGSIRNKILFILRTSKMHCQGDAPQTIKITGRSKEPKNSKDLKDYGSFSVKFCPFHTLNSYIDARPASLTNQNEQFFIFQDRSLVKPDHIRNHLHLMLKRRGLKEYLYNFHGIRAGRAGDLLKLGVSVENIKKAGKVEI